MKRRTNLDDVPAGALVGRAVDRAALTSIFDEGARLVSIVGPGGMGKTSLATAFARDHLASYSQDGDGGVWFCDLTSAASPTDACTVIASVLGARLAPNDHDEAPVVSLSQTLRRRGRLLLVLDNFEHLVGSSARIVADLLREAPRARILTTTRVSLGLPGEYRWPLQGLGQASLAADASAESLRNIESIELFLRRAHQIRPDFEGDLETLRAIAGITTKLEGMPLAIELAAARVAVLSAAQIHDRLREQGADVLARKTDEGRHRSMHAVVLDSLRLLDERERACLLACSVFRDGFTVSAIEAVTNDATRALDDVEALLAHSLLRRMHVPGEPRFTLYEVVREVIESELDHDADLRQHLRNGHAVYFATLVGRQANAPLQAYEEDLSNLLQAHTTLTSGVATASDGAHALALAAAVDPLLLARGRLALRLEVMARTLALAASDERLRSTPDFVTVLVAQAHARAELGAFDDAKIDLERALASQPNPCAEAKARVGLGVIVEARGDTAEAAEHFARALDRAEQVPPTSPLFARAREVEAEARAALAHALRREGRLDEAEAAVHSNIALYRAIGSERGIAAMTLEAGVHALFREKHDAAVGHFGEALALARRAGLRALEGAILSARGVLEQERGNLTDARTSHEQAVTIFRETGMPYSEASALYYLAGAHLESGQQEDAETIFVGALQLVRGVGVPRYQALILGALASIHARRGALTESRALLDEADTIAKSCQREPSLLTTLAVHRFQLTIRASQAESIDAARDLVRRHPCDDPRFALRVLEASARNTDIVTSNHDRLEVRPGGKAFRLPTTADEVDLSRRPALARILGALARQRVEAPGEGLGVDDVLAAGWPDERIRYEAGANRVYVALAELRKIGLRDWLVTDERGYRLTTSKPVVVRG